MSFIDTVVLITGTSRGIGRAITETFAARAAKVVGTATSESGAETISVYLVEKSYGKKLNVSSILKAISQNTVLGTPNKLACSVFITEPQLNIGLMLQLGS